MLCWLQHTVLVGMHALNRNAFFTELKTTRQKLPLDICICIDNRCVLVTQSCPTLCEPRTVTHQDPLFEEFSWEECWTGLPFSSPEDLPDPGIEPGSP